MTWQSKTNLTCNYIILKRGSSMNKMVTTINTPQPKPCQRYIENLKRDHNFNARVTTQKSGNISERFRKCYNLKCYTSMEQHTKNHHKKSINNYHPTKQNSLIILLAGRLHLHPTYLLTNTYPILSTNPYSCMTPYSHSQTHAYPLSLLTLTS